MGRERSSSTGERVTGRAVSSYRIERSIQPDQNNCSGRPGPWTLIATGYAEKVSLKNQPHGVEFHYRVLAANAAGVSLPGNSATAVL